MPSRISTTAANQALTTLAADYTWVSLNSGDPAATGASEIAGVTRQQVTWAAASGGQVTNSGALVIPVPSGGTAAYWSAWSAAAGGTYGFGGVLTSSQTFNTAGNYDINPGQLVESLN